MAGTAPWGAAEGAVALPQVNTMALGVPELTQVRDKARALH